MEQRCPECEKLDVVLIQSDEPNDEGRIEETIMCCSCETIFEKTDKRIKYKKLKADWGY